MGSLKLLTLPIGNLGDITTNVRESLTSGKFFAVEDTRSFKKLMDLLEISTNGKVIESLHDHSDMSKIDRLLGKIKEGNTLYYLSEAGSPIVSDPAFPLVKRAIEKGVVVDGHSGISAVIAALELSGLSPIPFTFHGFFPRDTKKQKLQVSRLKDLLGTHIIFESPNRVKATAKILCENFPNSEFSFCRELTKKFQSVYRFCGSDYEEMKEQLVDRGEYVILFNVKDKRERQVNIADVEKAAAEVLSTKGKKKPLAKLLSLILDKRASELYDQL